jgi:hypothetical protein
MADDCQRSNDSLGSGGDLGRSQSAFSEKSAGLDLALTLSAVLAGRPERARNRAAHSKSLQQETAVQLQ